MNKTTYYVRPSMILHKKSFSNARLTTQIFQDGEAIELTPLEAINYAHLIETIEQVNSRKTTTKKETK